MLLQRGITITALANRLRCSPSFVSQVISGSKRSQEKEKAICKLLHVPRSALWKTT